MFVRRWYVDTNVYALQARMFYQYMYVLPYRMAAAVIQASLAA